MAKLHDLSICGVDGGGLISERQLAEALLFRSGRPILIVPRSHRLGFACERVAIAWDYSAPAARAVAEAVPLLQKATGNLIFVVGDDKTFDTNLNVEDVLDAFRARGVDASVRMIERGGLSIGEALQRAALAEAADLLVMGAFAHSRVRELILGGATRDVLSEPQLPVLLTH